MSCSISSVEINSYIFAAQFSCCLELVCILLGRTHFRKFTAKSLGISSLQGLHPTGKYPFH